MKTKIITFATILAMLAVMLTTAIMAYSTEEVNTADAMNELGLFRGRDDDYALDASLKRIEGVVMIIRMLGKEDEAQSGSYENIFKDVPAWAEGYVAYAYATGITKGVSEAEGIFDTESSMTDFMFLTFTLRALGYTDLGTNAQFVWNNPYDLAKTAGLIDYDTTDTEFTRAEAVCIFWEALDSKLNGEERTLAEKLIEEGVFTAEELENARNTQLNGRTENVGKPLDTTADTEETTADTEETTADTEETTADTEEAAADTEETTADTEEAAADTEEDSVDDTDTPIPNAGEWN